LNAQSLASCSIKFIPVPAAFSFFPDIFQSAQTADFLFTQTPVTIEEYDRFY